ncbi:MAG: hypothetical protein J6O40_04820 [Ruminococcus sp.]|nr:hypothetical protein [Ruminococcus sp.]
MNINENYEKYIESLSPEVQEKFSSAKSAEEIKALIEEYDVELPLDALENIAGGFEMHDPGIFWQMRFRFTPDDIKIVKEKFGVELQAGKEYARGDLNSLLGLNCRNGKEMRNALYAFGLHYEGEY